MRESESEYKARVSKIDSKSRHTSSSSVKSFKGSKVKPKASLVKKPSVEQPKLEPLLHRDHESLQDDQTSEKFSHFFDEKTVNDDIVSEQSIEEYEDNVIDSEGYESLKKTVTVTRRSRKKKEVTYESGRVKTHDENIGTEPEREKDENEEDDDEYVWVEEEVEEEIEAETSEEDVEIEEEEIEEEGEEKYLEEIAEAVEEVEEETVIAEGEEDREFFKEEIEEEIEEIEAAEDLERDEETEEEREETREEEIEEEREEQDVIEVQLSETDLVEAGEEIEEEFKEGEEQMMEGEEFEEGLGEEEELTLRKKKRKIKTVRIVRMVRKLKKDVIKELKEKARPVEIEEEISEEKIEESPSEPEAIKLTEEEQKEREKIFEMMKLLLNELIFLKRRNKALSKNIIDYYKQKKGENVIEVETPGVETVRKYHKRLNLLTEFQKAVAIEMERLTNETNELKDELSTKSKAYEDEKFELLQWEEAVGKSVIIAQTGKPLEDSVVTHLVQRHDIILNQLSKERLLLVTLQYQMSEKEAALKQLVAFEGKLSLIDYEQLRMDNQIFSDKLEERDNELAHLRKKVLEIIHTHAHVLEKTATITEDIDTYCVQDEKTNSEMVEIREKVNKFKKTRDNLRGETSRMRKNAGLLIRPKLAIDFEESVHKIDYTRNKVEKLIKTYKKQKVTIENLRKEIIDATTFRDLF